MLCDGRPEYFESSCRAYGHVWSPLTLGRRRDLRSAFYRLRPVIMSGWEMPVLVRALVTKVPERRIHTAWPEVREGLVAAALPRAEMVDIIRKAVDSVRRDWIRVAPDAWLAAHRPYVPLATLRHVVQGPERAVVVTTKEGEFAHRILDGWDVAIRDVHGKERGEHKCDNLVELLDDPRTGGDGEVWFVEDRLETLECAVRCTEREPKLARARLFLAAWGYNTPDARRRARGSDRITLLTRDTFARGVTAWSWGAPTWPPGPHSARSAPAKP